MKIKLLLIVALFFGFSIHSAIADTKYHKTDSKTLAKIKHKATFKMLVPSKIPPKWTLEVKVPYPLDLTKPINDIQLHYFNQDEMFMVAIRQYKATRDTVLEKESSSPNYLVEKVFIHNTEGRFTPRWRTSGENGGYLSWIQNGTYIQMESFNLTKDGMMKMAELMK